MGIVPLPLVLTLLSAVTPTASPQPWSDARFQELLVSGTIPSMEQACLDPMAAGTKLRKQQLRDRLLAIHPVPASFDLTMRNAGALLTTGQQRACIAHREIKACRNWVDRQQTIAKLLLSQLCSRRHGIKTSLLHARDCSLHQELLKACIAP